MNKDDPISRNTASPNKYTPISTDEGKEFNKLLIEIDIKIQSGDADINAKEHNEWSDSVNSNPLFDNLWRCSKVKNDLKRISSRDTNTTLKSKNSDLSMSFNNDMVTGNLIMQQRNSRYSNDYDSSNIPNNNAEGKRPKREITIPSDSDEEDNDNYNNDADDDERQVNDKTPKCPFKLTSYPHSTNHNSNTLVNFTFVSNCDSYRRSNKLYHSHNSIGNPKQNYTMNNNQQLQQQQEQHQQRQANYYRSHSNMINSNPFACQLKQSIPSYQSKPYTPTRANGFYVYDMNAFSYNNNNNHPPFQQQQQPSQKKNINVDLRRSEKKKSSTSKALNSAGENGEMDYTINIENIILGIDERTTIMIKNVPSKYTSQGLISEFEGKFKKKFDMFYLPLDYNNESNLGYAFLNFIDPLYIVQFYHCYKGWQWTKYDSNKVCDISYAEYQGKEKSIAHLKKKNLEKSGEEKKAILFSVKKPYPKISIPIIYRDLIMKYNINYSKGIEFIS